MTYCGQRNDMEWISVKDRLPEKHKWYLGWTGNEVEVVYLNINNNFDIIDGGRWDAILVTHWMSLPNPPKE